MTLPLGVMWALLLAWTPSGFAAQDVLLVGNSFVLSNQPHGVTGVLAGLQEAQGGGQSPSLTDVSKGGYTLTMHASDAAGNGALNTYLVTGDPSTYAYGSVVLQEQSQTAGFHVADNPMGPGYMWDESLVATEYLNSLVRDRGAETVFLMTWGYRNGDSSIPDNLFDGFPDYTTMQSALIEGYEMYADGLSTVDRTVFVAPAGRAFQRVFDDLVASGADPLAQGSPFDDLYSGDGRHPALQGSYLAGCVLYATLTGRDPRRLSWAPEAIPDARRELLQAAAAAVTIEDPYVTRSLAWGDVPRFPFVTEYSDLLGEDVTEAVLGAVNLRPTALLDRIAPPVQSLVIGDGEFEAGRMGVFDGGRLTVGGPLTVGRAGEGVLEVKGGEVTAASLRVADAQGSYGVLSVEAGTIEVATITSGGGEAQVTMTGGTLRTSALSIPLTVSGGRLEIVETGSSSAPFALGAEATLALPLADAPDGPARLTFTDEATLTGTLVVTLGPDTTVYSGRYVLVEGPSLVTDELTMDVSWLGLVDIEVERVDTADGGQQLALNVSGAASAPGSLEGDAEDTEPPEDTAAAPEPDVGPEVETLTGDPESGDALESGGAQVIEPTTSEPSSGCQSHLPRQGGAPWAFVCCLVALLRRRYLAMRSQASIMRLG